MVKSCHSCVDDSERKVVQFLVTILTERKKHEKSVMKVIPDLKIKNIR